MELEVKLLSLRATSCLDSQRYYVRRCLWQEVNRMLAHTQRKCLRIGKGLVLSGRARTKFVECYILYEVTLLHVAYTLYLKPHVHMSHTGRRAVELFSRIKVKRSTATIWIKKFESKRRGSRNSYWRAKYFSAFADENVCCSSTFIWIKVKGTLVESGNNRESSCLQGPSFCHSPGRNITSLKIVGAFVKIRTRFPTVVQARHFERLVVII
jgi:hypothetical protein